MTRDISAILFDKDGTLIDYHLSWRPINDRAALHAARGDERLAARLLQLAGADPATGRVAADSLLAAATPRDIAAAWIAAGSPFTLGPLAGDLDRIFCAGVEDAVPVTDLAELFARLKGRGLALGIASSDSAAAIAATARRFEIDRHLDFIAGYDSRHGTKPDPGMLLAFARQSGLPASTVAVVGDNLHDMRMASAGGAGLKVAVLTGTGTREMLEGAADVCLESIAGLEAALSGRIDPHGR
ncbi:MAG: HAD family hydrolase [Hyphomicrobiaceae bacterium]|nr:HAD family hydrolase [Hyphomicrobiaceae bacterium]